MLSCPAEIEPPIATATVLLTDCRRIVDRSILAGFVTCENADCVASHAVASACAFPAGSYRCQGAPQHTRCPNEPWRNSDRILGLLKTVAWRGPGLGGFV